MSIITKPSTIFKGSISQFTLNINELVLLVSDSYFQDTQNWKTVSFWYRSSNLVQNKVVKFEISSQSPSANFLATNNSLDSFEIQKIIIKDFDNDYFVITRSQVNSAELDISFAGLDQNEYILLEDSEQLLFEDNTYAILN